MNFDLTTEQGRAHAYLHSPEAAALVRSMEKGMEAIMRVRQARAAMPLDPAFNRRAEILLEDLLEELEKRLGASDTLTQQAFELLEVLSDAAKVERHNLETAYAILNLI